MPVYNAQDSLRRSVKSVLVSTYENIELILVDDGSTDASGDICDEIALSDERVRVVHKKNGGPASARNAGLDKVCGTWLMWVDADDEIEPGYVQTLVDVACDKHANLVISDCLVAGKPFNFIVPGKTYFSREELWEDFLNSHVPWSLWAKLYKASLFECLRFNEDDYIAEDLDMNARIFLHEGLHVVTIPDIGYHYAQTNGSVDNSFTSKHLVQFDVFDRVVQMALRAGMTDEAAAHVFYAERCLNALKKAYHAGAMDNPEIRRCVRQYLAKYRKDLLRGNRADRGLKLRIRVARAGWYGLLDRV